ncbi:MAG: hypothetical protein IT260_24210 [Saprospiraceae bacterium]|nr:hypothetical protein [Saprospiraceae bacterium]
MQDDSIKQLWDSYHAKLDENLRLTHQNTTDLAQMKVRTFLNSMQPLKIFTLLVGILWVVFVDVLLFALYPVASPYFLVSAAIQVLLTKLAIGIYLYQLILIWQVDISEPILATQERIARLLSSTMWIARLLFLQLPVWTTFYWTEGLVNSGSLAFYRIQIPVTLAFAGLAVWLFVHIKYENRHQKWFRLLFEGKEWSPVIKSMELLEQIEEYKMERGF